MTRRRRSRSGRSPSGRAVSRLTWSKVQVQVWKSVPSGIIKSLMGPASAADPWGSHSPGRPLGDQNSVPVLVGDLPATARMLSTKNACGSPPGPLKKNRSCLVPSLFSWMFDFSCFFVFHFFVFLRLLVLSVHALYGGPKGSPKWLKITFEFLDFQCVSESYFLQYPRIPFKT